jgi:hypothetical protein
MYKIIPVFVFSLLLICLFAGCHAGQEKAWAGALETTNQKIAEDEFLSKNVQKIEIERRQLVRVYILPQSARNNFATITNKVTQIFGDALFSYPGNKFKEFMVYGSLVDGDELIVCKYTKDGAKIEKDRTMMTM